MKTHIGKLFRLAMLMFSLALLVGGCGGGGGSTPTGTVSVGLTDAPNTSFVHVWITVKEVWFHTSDVAGTNDAGWLKFPLKDAGGNPTAVTVDLITLANGAAPNTIWNGNITLPVGSYRQMRIFLADTDNETLTNFQLPGGVVYNNEVDYLDSTGTLQKAPLEIPSSDDGISVVPETPIVVTTTSDNKLVLDFDAGHDVVGPVSPTGTPEFILKPRLKYFDMNQAGAITGTIAKTSFSNYTGFNFVVKAEKLYSNPADPSDPNTGKFNVVRRATGLAQPGQFALYPLPIFGNATTASFDVLLRGRGVQTYIVQGVKVHKGTTPTGMTPATSPTNLGTITMASAPEYTAQLQNAFHPTGAWVNFYQSVNGSMPYEVRFRHLDPFVGKLYASIPLSAGPVNVAPWQSGVPLAFQSVAPDQGLGTFWTAPGAEMYARVAPSAANAVTGSAGQVDRLFTTSALTAQPAQDSITFAFMFPQLMMNFPQNGQAFATHGGMIVDSIGTLAGETTVGMAMHSGGGLGNPVTISNLPGGSSSVSLPGAFYGLYAVGWGGRISVGAVRGIDLRSGSQGSIANPIQMKMY